MNISETQQSLTASQAKESAAQASAPRTTDSADQKAARKVGNQLAEIEDAALEAFTISEASQERIKDIAQRLGMIDSDKTVKISLDSLRIFAQHALQKAQSAYEMLSYLFQIKKRSADAVINNIGR